MTNNKHMLSNKLYDNLKTVALVILPACGALYFTLAGIWGLPAAEQVLGTIVAVDTFLGALIKLGDRSYNSSEARFDGDMVVQDKAGKFIGYTMELNGDPQELKDKDEVIFKVKNPARG